MNSSLETSTSVAPVDFPATLLGEYKTTLPISTEQESVDGDLLASWLPLALKYPLSKKSAIAPNVMLRGGVFSSQRYTGRVAKRTIYTEPQLVVRTLSFEVWQNSGERLDQGDADVAFELFKLASSFEAENGKVSFSFTEKEFLHNIHRESTNGDRSWLAKSLSRMQNASFRVLFHRNKRRLHEQVVQFAILDSAAAHCESDDKATTRHHVAMGTEISQLIEDGWSLLNLDQRSELRGNPLAQWLLDFYSTHKVPKPYGQKKLKIYSGRVSMQDSKWRKALAAAVDRVKEVTQWPTCELDAAGTLIIGKDPKIRAIRPFDPNKRAKAVATAAAPKKNSKTNYSNWILPGAAIVASTPLLDTSAITATLFDAVPLDGVLALFDRQDLDAYNRICDQIIDVDDATRRFYAIRRIEEKLLKKDLVARSAAQAKEDVEWKRHESIRRQELADSWAAAEAAPFDENEEL